MSDTKNEAAWKRLFEKYKILEKIEKHGVFEITSSQINTFREARLMTKFDHWKNLPQIFKKYNLSILPVTRGNYLISQFEAYKDFEEKETEIIKAPFPTDEGRRLFRLKYIPRQLKLVELILSHKAFSETFKLYMKQGYLPSKYEIVEIMKRSNLYNVKSEATFYRRASSIAGWINWILELVNYN